MYSHLQLLPYSGGTPRIIDGKILLFLLQKAVEDAPHARPAQTGESNDPYRPRSAAQWFGCTRSLTQSDNKYLTMSGRMLKKDFRVYISDQGPVWRYKENMGLATPVTSKMYQGNPPTYQTAAQRIERPHEVFPRSHAEGVRKPSWSNIAKTRTLVRVMRRLLKGEPIIGETGLSADYSRIQHSLPVLTAAMFWAEPARNQRALPINLMLLDLAECGIPMDPATGAPASLVSLIWHPDALDVTNSSSLSQRQREPSTPTFGPEEEQRHKLARVTRVDRLHYVGGVMPSSPTQGGEIGNSYTKQLQVAPDKDVSNVPPQHRQRALASFRKSQLRIQKYDFILQKEASVLCLWLSKLWPYTFRAVPSGQFVQTDVEEISELDVFYQEDYGLRLHLQLLKLGFERRCQTLDNMLSH